jgi:hypothetical protein
MNRDTIVPGQCEPFGHAAVASIFLTVHSLATHIVGTVKVLRSTACDGQTQMWITRNRI